MHGMHSVATGLLLNNTYGTVPLFCGIKITKMAFKAFLLKGYFKMLLVFGLVSMISGSSVHLSFELETDCLINFVWGMRHVYGKAICHLTRYRFTPIPSRITTTRTLHHVTHLNYAIKLDDIESGNLTSKSGYFQFSGRLRDPCMAFMLLRERFD